MIQEQENGPTSLASETMNSIALTFMDSKSGFNYGFFNRYVSQISFYFPMRI